MALMRITVLVSGRGSNLAALVEASRASDFNGAVTQVISNRPAAAALEVARNHAIATSVVDHTRFATREAFDASLAHAIDASEPDLVILAGFMRVLDESLVKRYAGRMLNVHPSLLPAYPGLHTHRRAIADGVREHGCTVHFVTAAVDGGPVVAQAAVRIAKGDDEAALAARVLLEEHRLLPQAARLYCAGQLALREGRVWRDERSPRGGTLRNVPTGSI